MHRRDFLHPRHLVHSAGQLLAAADEIAKAGTKATREEICFLRTSHRAMATRFELILPFGTPHATTLSAEAFTEIDHLEQLLTVFCDSSEVSRLNQLAPLVEVPVEAGLFDLLDLSAELNATTEGAFDITCGVLIKLWGFYRGPRRVPSEEQLAQALERVGMRHVVLDRERQSVRYLAPGLEINLGSIGKGYALDRVVEFLRDRWGLSVGLLHGGHSSVFAIGSEPGDDRGWSVGIRHPWEPDRRLAIVRLRNRALGTSAATHQHLEYKGRKLGHILDPRTGWPAEEMASASVVAPTAAQADALATAFFILGVDKARAYCAKHPGIGAVLLPKDELPQILGLTPEEFSIFDS
jgi:thiamine biosynthesis lipoprotein